MTKNQILKMAFLNMHELRNIFVDSYLIFCNGSYEEKSAKIGYRSDLGLWKPEKFTSATMIM